MNYDLKIIKKKYGEKFSHLCRDLFPTLLEEKGLLSRLLLDNFDENHYLYYDILDDGLGVQFSHFIYGLVDKENNSCDEIVKTPYELMDEAGYDLFECVTESDIKKFRKYYVKGEELCTFNGGRLDRCHVFFAVKKDVDKIKRIDFKKPDRQDLYGTSVISIQFSRDSSHTLSIKNRYNHRVSNPDATFSNNLDNIIGGLTDSFAKFHGLVQKKKHCDFEISGYVRANDGKYYKYNHEINNVYYCFNNVIIDNFKVERYDKSRYLIIDYFIIDMVDKKIEFYDESIKDCFVGTIGNIKNINIVNNDVGKKIIITNQDDKIFDIVIDNLNRIIEFSCDDIKKIGNNFLNFNQVLEKLNMPNVETIGRSFLYSNMVLKELRLEKLKSVDSNFMFFNKDLKTLIVPNLEVVNNYFLFHNVRLEDISFNNLKSIGFNCLVYNRYINSLIAPNLVEVGHNFMCNNSVIHELYVPNLESVGNKFLSNTNRFKRLTFDCLEEVGDNFLFSCGKLEELNTPKLVTVGNGFLARNVNLKKVNFDSLETVEDRFLESNKLLDEISMPNLLSVGNNFIYMNDVLNKVYLPKLEIVGDYFLLANNKLVELELNNLLEVGEGFLKLNYDLQKLVAPKLESVGYYFLTNNLKLSSIIVPNLWNVGHGFLKAHSQRWFILRQIKGYGTFLDDIVNKIKKRSLHVDAGGRFRRN